MAIVGRPNVGKSTLLNLLVGMERATVSDIPGTTRDSVSAEWACEGRRMILADTGGLRRRRAESELERLSEAATRRALRRADAALLLTDLSAGATRQDKRTAALIWEAGKAAVVGANKSDLVPAKERAGRAARLAEALPFLSPPRAFHFSAARGRVPALGMMDAALRAAGMNARQFPTAKLTRILEEMVVRHPPPRAGGVRPKLRYAHQGGERPPMIVIHGSATTRTGAEYRRYLESGFARELGLAGVPLRVVFRES